MRSGEDILTTPSKIMDYLREKVCGLFIECTTRKFGESFSSLLGLNHEIMYACFVELQC